jgi:hypothetical protein
MPQHGFSLVLQNKCIMGVHLGTLLYSKNWLFLALLFNLQESTSFSSPSLALLGPAPHSDRDYRIGSNFWKFYLIRTGFTLDGTSCFGESV